MFLSRNQFFDLIPSELGLLSGLGKFPECQESLELANVSQIQLQSSENFVANENFLSGSLPAEVFTSMTSLSKLVCVDDWVMG
jgi:hypothetical protein